MMQSKFKKKRKVFNFTLIFFFLTTDCLASPRSGELLPAVSDNTLTGVKHEHNSNVQKQHRRTFNIDMSLGDRASVNQYDDYSYTADFYSAGIREKTHSIELNPINNNVLITIKKNTYKLVLPYYEYNAFNTRFNIARLMSKEFNIIKDDIIYCTINTDSNCTSGWFYPADPFITYQPHYTRTILEYRETELGNGSVKVDFDGNSIQLSKHGNGLLVQKNNGIRKHAKGNSKDKGKGKANKSNNNRKNANRRYENSPRSNANSLGGSGADSGDDGNGDDDKQNPDKRKNPDDYREDPANNNNEEAYHNGNLHAFINQALRISVSGNVEVDVNIMSAINRFLRTNDFESIKRLADFLLLRLRNEYGISGRRVATEIWRVSGSIEQEPEYEEFDKNYQSGFQSELVRAHTESMESPYINHVHRLLNIYYGAILNSPLIEDSLTFFQNHGFKLPSLLNAQQNNEEVASSLLEVLTQGAAKARKSCGLRTFEMVNGIFDGKMGAFLLTVMISGFFYDNSTDLFSDSVNTHQFYLYSTALACLLGQAFPSFFNSYRLAGVLRRDNNSSILLMLTLVGLNVMKDIFSVVGTGAGLINQSAYTRFCQGAYALSYTLFSYLLIMTMTNVSDANSDEPGEPKNFRLPRGVIMPLAISTLGSGVFYVTTRFSGFNFSLEGLDYISFILTSLANNLLTVHATMHEEAFRILAFFSLLFTLSTTINQHRYLHGLYSENSSTREVFEIIRRNLWVFYFNSIVSGYTLILSFADRYGNNPLVFYMNLILNFIKSRIFEHCVNSLRIEALARPVIENNSASMERDFMACVNSVNNSGASTVAEYIQAFFDQLVGMSVPERSKKILELKGLSLPNVDRFMHKLKSRSSTLSVTRGFIPNHPDSQPQAPVHIADFFPSRFHVTRVPEGDEQATDPSKSEEDVVIDIAGETEDKDDESNSDNKGDSVSPK